MAKKYELGGPNKKFLDVINPIYHNNMSTITIGNDKIPIDELLDIDRDNNRIKVRYHNKAGNPIDEWIVPAENFWNVADTVYDEVDAISKGTHNAVRNLSNVVQGAPTGQSHIHTTGGAGYIPEAGPSLPELLYQKTSTLDPYDISVFIKNLTSNDRYNRTEDNVNAYMEQIAEEAADSVKLDDDYLQHAFRGLKDAKIADELYAIYLGIPEFARRYNRRLKESPYKKGAFALPLDNYTKQLIIEDTQGLKHGTGINTDMFSSMGLDTSSIGRNVDDRGEYAAYWDSVDLNPFKGKFALKKIPYISDMEDLSFGLFNSVPVYGREYLDDYYEVPQPTHATYLPEVIKWGHANGGPLMRLANRFDDGGPENPTVGTQYDASNSPFKFNIPIDIGTDLDGKKVAKRMVEYGGDGKWLAHYYADDGTDLGVSAADFLGVSEEETKKSDWNLNPFNQPYLPTSGGGGGYVPPTPDINSIKETIYFGTDADHISALDKLKKRNPEISDVFDKAYEYHNNLSKYGEYSGDDWINRFWEAYKYAGFPKIKPLKLDSFGNSTEDKRPYYLPLTNTMYVLYGNDVPREKTIADILDELSHPLQHVYGNNSTILELLNPSYNVDNYRGDSRYVYPDKFEYETHTNFKPNLDLYIHYKAPTDWNLDSVLINSARDNARDQKLFRENIMPSKDKWTNGIGDWWSYGGPLVQEANMFRKGGPKKSYAEWKRQISTKKGIVFDNTYDYRGYYNKYPEEAWDMLKRNSEEHFPDEFKTVYHPTFSTQSIYSGVYHPVFNPHALKGGSWNGDKYIMSEDMYKAPINMDERLDYLQDFEDNGVSLREYDGTWPIYDGVPLAGILPNVEVTGKLGAHYEPTDAIKAPIRYDSNYAEGGQLETPMKWNDLSVKEKADMMKVAIRNGITDLSAIKDKYNEFADGGYRESSDKNLYSGGSWLGRGNNNLLDINRSFANSTAGKNLQNTFNNIDTSIVKNREILNNTEFRNPYDPSITYSSGSLGAGSKNAIQYAINFFVNKGLERHQAIGLVANLMRESSLNPGAINKSSGAFGLAQLLGNRKSKYFSMYGNNPNSFQNQLEYIWWELNNTHKTGLARLKASKTVDEAAANAFGYYEFSAGIDGAVKAMNASGQNGQKALNMGINYARQFAGLPVLKDAEYPYYLEGKGMNGYQYDAMKMNESNNTNAFNPIYDEMFFKNQEQMNQNAEALAHMQAMIDNYYQEKAHEAELAQEAAIRAEKRNRRDKGLALLNVFMNSRSQGEQGDSKSILDMASPLMNFAAQGGNLYFSGGNKRNTGLGRSVPSNHEFYTFLPQLFASDGVSIRISSGYRPNAMTRSNHKSRHATEGQAADIVPINQSTFDDILRVLDDRNSNTSQWLAANGYGYLNETLPEIMAKTGATGKHVHIGMDTNLASKYAQAMGAKYNPNPSPVFQLPSPKNPVGPALPPVENYNMSDKDLFAQNNILNQQANAIAQAEAQWGNILAQEKANAEATAEQEENRQKALGLNLAMGIIGNMGARRQQLQESPMTNIFKPLVSNFLGNNIAAYGGNLYDGETSPTGQMTTSKPVYTNKVRQRPDGSYYYIDDNNNQWPMYEIGGNRYATYNTEGNINHIFNLNPSAVEAVKPSWSDSNLNANQRLENDWRKTPTYYDQEYIWDNVAPFVQLLDPTGISNYPDLAKSIINGDSTADIALNFVSALPFISKFGRIPKIGFMTRKAENLRKAATGLEKWLASGAKNVTMGPFSALYPNVYQKIQKTIIPYQDILRGTRRIGSDALKLRARQVQKLSDWDAKYNEGRWAREALYDRMANSNGYNGISAEVNHLMTGLGMIPYSGDDYTGFYYSNNDGTRAVSGDNIFEDKNALLQYFYGNGNLTPYQGLDTIVQSGKWNYPQFSEKILPVDKEHPLRVSDNVKGILDEYINDNSAFTLNADFMPLTSDRLGQPIYDAKKFGVKPYIDENGNYYLKAFDKFDFSGTVTGGDFVENKLNKSHKYYPNSGPFVVRQDSIPIIFTPDAEDEKMFMNMYNN